MKRVALICISDFPLSSFTSYPSLPKNILCASPTPFHTVIDKFDYVFAENGTVQYKNGQLVSKQVGLASSCSATKFPPPLSLPSVSKGKKSFLSPSG